MPPSQKYSMWQKMRNYWPFTWSTVIISAVLWALFRILYSKPADPKQAEPDAFQPFITLMAKLVLFAGLGLMVLSALSAFITWGIFLLQRNAGARPLEISFDTKAGRPSRLTAVLRKGFRPLLGFVTGRLQYEDRSFSLSFPLSGSRRKRGKLMREGLEGSQRWELPEVREYGIKGAVIRFEDQLRIFSLPAWQPLAGHFVQPPVAVTDHQSNAEPRHTETLDVRINKMKRVEGDLLHYKSFESGDDVRRIVWKVYARNRDLVVRVPERFEPYASHLYLYTSFHTDLPAAFDAQGDALRECLTYYKNNVWTIYKALAEGDAGLRYIPDQPVNIPEALDADTRVQRIITASRWHADNPLPDYFEARKAAVLVVSSLVSPDDLREVLDRSSASTVVYLLKVSEVFRGNAALHWMRRIIFRPEDDRLAKLRGRWMFSPLRVFLKRREAVLEEILSGSMVERATVRA